MITFNYVIKDPVGIHARPAGLLVNAAKEFESAITIEKQGKKPADLKRLFQVMALGIKNGEEVILTFTGADEEEAYKKVSELLKTNL